MAANPKNRQSKPDETVQYLVLSSDGDFVIEIPAHWRVTFGYVNPSSSGDAYNRGQGHCLRVWEGEKLRAVWGNVRGFRDMAIPLARKISKETGASEWTRDSLGNFKQSSEASIEHALIPETFDEEIPF